MPASPLEGHLNAKQRSARKLPQTRAGKKPAPKLPLGSFLFPQVRGKTVTDVYVTADNEINCVTVAFDDDTELVIDVDPCFAVRFTAGYSDWKSGNQRVIKSWPRIRT